MTTLDAASFNLQLVKGFFDERQCGEIHHRALACALRTLLRYSDSAPQLL